MKIFTEHSKRLILKALPFIVSLIFTFVLFAILFNYSIENGYVTTEVISVWI
jgi:hypothetical protein